MSRQFIADALYADHLPSGAWCALIPKAYCVTHLGAVSFPQGETFGPLFLRCTDVGGFRFAGQAHDHENPAAYERIGAAWVSLPPPCFGVSPLIYDHEGNLHCSNGSVGSQGYRYVTPENTLISGDATYGPFHGLFEYTYLEDGLWIGQGAEDGSGIRVWDGTLRQLETGTCRFLRANRVGDVVALAFTRPDGVVLIRTTMAELRALPPVVDRQPGPVVNVPPDHHPPPLDQYQPVHHPKEPPVVPPHQESIPMIAYASPIPGFASGDLVDNGNSTVSVKKPNGQFLCVTPEGHVEERPTGGGAWESFRKGKSSLIAERDGGAAGAKVYVLPLVE